MASIKKTILGAVKLEKAVITTYNGEKKKSDITVQFNPTQLEMSRNIKINKKGALMKDEIMQNMVSASSGFSSFKVTLQFDSYSNYGPLGYLSDSASNKAAGAIASGLGLGEKSYDKINLDVNNVVDKFRDLIRFDPKLHRAPGIRFKWGENVDFFGYASDVIIKYTMFERDGTPVRATVDLSLVGDTSDKIKFFSNNKFESPDRTKTRFLPYGEQLWMLADVEYGDVGKWKVIALANDILNPRTVASARSMKVPSIR